MPKSARTDDRKMNVIFWVLRTGMPWRDLPERYRSYTPAYHRFNTDAPTMTIAEKAAEMMLPETAVN
jgi:transposase